MSSDDLGVRAEGLGKRFQIPVPGKGSRLPFRRTPREPLWALRDVSFEVARGTTLGIIGRNGSGKTTLLKILSRITPPTTGRAVLAGKASSLLEVGTGFHPELTGRENVYMNGAVLGMHRAEITRKFDAIVAFAEVEAFIDTPVKRYSSGMSLRLAFSVAAHLEPEILLVDEVLAVGDAAFQQKSLGKIGEVTSQGRTVILVSHSMPTVASLADACIWLDGGAIREQGEPGAVIRSYLERTAAVAAGEEVDLTDRERQVKDEGRLRFAKVRLLSDAGEVRRHFYEGEPMTIEVEVDAGEAASMLELRAYVKTLEGFWLFSALSGKREVSLEAGRFSARTRIAPNHLRPGQYQLDLGMQTSLPQDFVHDAARFEVRSALEGYDDPVLRGDTGRLRFDYVWTEAQQLPAGL
jgi:lipopolysaccharide transport system ATP-binding protein